MLMNTATVEVTPSFGHAHARTRLALQTITTRTTQAQWYTTTTKIWTRRDNYNAQKRVYSIVFYRHNSRYAPGLSVEDDKEQVGGFVEVHKRQLKGNSPMLGTKASGGVEMQWFAQISIS